MAINKNSRVLRRMKVLPATVIDTRETDKLVIDTVLKTLYENADRDVLKIEEQIYKPNNIVLNSKDAERIWEILIASGWISPVVGFGNAGKISLTREGYQLMAQHGGYIKYLEALNSAKTPNTVILPLQIQEEQDPEITPPIEKKKDRKK